MPRSVSILSRTLSLPREDVRRALVALDAYQLEEPDNAAPPRGRRLVRTLEHVEIMRRRR